MAGREDGGAGAEGAGPVEDGTFDVFARVQEGFEKRNSLAYVDSVACVKTAFYHLSTPEALEFVDAWLLRIIGILLEQQPGRLEPAQKASIEDTMYMSANILVALFEQGRASFLPCLYRLFDRKNVFYAGTRGYWHNIPGHPQVRRQAVTRFANGGGFGHVLTILQADQSAWLGASNWSVLLQALCDAKNKKALVETEATPNFTDSFLRIAQDQITALDEDSLKKENTDDVADMLKQLMNLVSVEAQGAFHEFWLALALKFMDCASLPLRLFSWDVLGEVIVHALSRRPIPRRFRVKGAGNPVVNGIYEVFTKPGETPKYWYQSEEGPLLTLFRCTMRSKAKWWFISEADKDRPGTDQDIDYYQHKSHQDQWEQPPCTAWTTCSPRSPGRDPPPLLVRLEPMLPEGVDDEEAYLATFLETKLLAWVDDNDIFSRVFGDSAHREIVSRSGKLLNLMAENQRLTHDQVQSIWEHSFDHSEMEVVDEIYNVLAGSALFMEESLFVELIQTVQQSATDGSHFAEAMLFAEKLNNAGADTMAQIGPDAIAAVRAFLWELYRNPAFEKSKSAPSVEGFFHACVTSPAHVNDFVEECIVSLRASASGEGAVVPNDDALRRALTHFKFLLHTIILQCGRDDALMAVGTTGAQAIASAAAENPAIQAADENGSDGTNAEAQLAYEELVRNEAEKVAQLLLEELCQFASRSQSQQSSVALQASSAAQSDVAASSPDDATPSSRGDDAAAGDGTAAAARAGSSRDDSLRRRFELLRFYLGLSVDLVLTTEQLERLWQLLQAPSEREVLMHFLANAAVRQKINPSSGKQTRDSYTLESAFSMHEVRTIFSDMLCSGDVDWAQTGEPGWECYRTFHGALNNAHDAESAAVVNKGVDTLWQIMQTSRLESVAGKATSLLLVVYDRLRIESPDSQMEMLHRVMEILREALKDLGAGSAASETQQQLCARIGRCIAMLKEAVASGKGEVPPAHAVKGRSDRITLIIRPYRTRRTTTGTGAVSSTSHPLGEYNLEAHPLHTVGMLRGIIAARADHPPRNTTLFRVPPGTRRRLTLKDMHRALRDVNTVENTTIDVTFGDHPVAYDGLDPLDMAGEQADHIADLLSGDNAYMETLFDLLDAVTAVQGSDDVGAKLWDLLQMIPTQAAREQTLVQGAFKNADASADVNWDELLSTESRARCVYALQIVDAILQPAPEFATEEASATAAAFRDRFVGTGGLGVVLRVFMRAKAVAPETAGTGAADGQQQDSQQENAGDGTSESKTNGSGSGKQAEDGDIAAVTPVGSVSREVPVALRVVKYCLFDHQGEDGGESPADAARPPAPPASGEDGDKASAARRILAVLEQASVPVDEFLKKLTVVATATSSSKSCKEDTVVSAIVTILHVLELPGVIQVFGETAQARTLVTDLLVNGSTSLIRAEVGHLATVAGRLLPEMFQWFTDLLEKLPATHTTSEELFTVMTTLLGEMKAPNAADLERLASVLSQKLLRYPRRVTDSSGTRSGSRTPPDVVLCGCLNLVTEIVKMDMSILDGTELGAELVNKAVHDFLFALPTRERREAVPLCTSPQARQAVFGLLREAVRNTPGVLRQVMEHMHVFLSLAKDKLRLTWNLQCSYEAKSDAIDFVGLRNQGCTCYMNSLLQQIFMTPDFREAVMTANLRDTQRTSLWHMNDADLVGQSMLVELDAGSWVRARCTGYDSSRRQHTVVYTMDNDDEYTEHFNLRLGRARKETGRVRLLGPSDLLEAALKEATEQAAAAAASGECGDGDGDNDESGDGAKADSKGGSGGTTGADEVKGPGSAIRATTDEHAKMLAKLEEPLDEACEVLEQVQRTFCFLRYSKKRYCDPRSLVEACRCLNLSFDVLQQNDASEFCDKLLDRLESGMTGTKSIKTLRTRVFGGRLVAQKIPKGCNHRGNREEPFLKVELIVRNRGSIEESLASFVEGEFMSGDNKVICDECDEKKDTTRRTCFERLPNLLILHLKRFDLDYNTFETIKLNNRCAFPATLNMKPYTREYIEQEELRANAAASGADEGERAADSGGASGNGSVSGGGAGGGEEEGEGASGPDLSALPELLDEDYEYVLQGVLVHAGIAQGGHYYSFIRDRESGGDNWYRFDDEDVSTFNPSEIEAQCYGGTATVSTTWQGMTNTVEEDRYANALMLFYDKVKKVTFKDDEDKDKDAPDAPELQASASTEMLTLDPSTSTMSSTGGVGDDSKQTEGAGASSSGEEQADKEAPPTSSDAAAEKEEEEEDQEGVDGYTAFEKEVWDNNLTFVIQTYLSDNGLHNFINQVLMLLVTNNNSGLRWEPAAGETKTGSGQEVAAVDKPRLLQETTQFALSFLLDVILHTRERENMTLWLKVLEKCLQQVPSMRTWYLRQLLGTSPSGHGTWLREFLLQCSDAFARQTFVRLTTTVVSTVVPPSPADVAAAAAAAAKAGGADGGAVASSITDEVRAEEELSAHTDRLKALLLEQLQEEVDVPPHSATEGASEDEKLLAAVLHRVISFIEEVPHYWRYSDDLFILIRELSGFPSVRTAMVEADMIGRLAYFLLEARAPDAVADAFPPYKTQNQRRTLVDQPAVLEALAATMGIPHVRRASLLDDKGSPWHAELTEDAKAALTHIFHDNSTHDTMNAADLSHYFERCSSSGDRVNSLHIRSILNRYETTMEGRLTLRGFLEYYRDTAGLQPKKVWNELLANDYGYDLRHASQSRGERSTALPLDKLVVPQLSDMCLHCELLYELALDLNPPVALKLMQRVSRGNPELSVIVLDLTLRQLHRCNAGSYYSYPTVSFEQYVGALAGLLSIDDDFQRQRIELAMEGENGILLVAREKVNQQGSYPANYQVGHQVTRYVEAFQALRARRNAQMDQWVEENADGCAFIVRLTQPVGGSRYDDTFDDENLRVSVLVEKAGIKEVNGRYEFRRMLEHAGLYEKRGTWKGKEVTFSLYRCQLEDQRSLAWYISVAPDGQDPGSQNDIDFYTMDTPTHSRLPPRVSWKGIQAGDRTSAPRIEIVDDTLPPVPANAGMEMDSESLSGDRPASRNSTDPNDDDSDDDYNQYQDGSGLGA